MSQILDTQRALVIGGGSGIGLASARMLARDGADVTIAGRTVEKLERAQAELRTEGVTVRTTRCDALDGSSVREAVAAADDGGRLDIAVVVPGGGSITPVLLYGD